jgi:hypothetical protein
MPISLTARQVPNTEEGEPSAFWGRLERRKIQKAGAARAKIVLKDIGIQAR